MKKINKLMSLLLAVTMVCMTGVMSFADDVMGDVSTRSCLTCNNIDAEHVHSDSCYNHAWDDGRVQKAATCTEAGEMFYTCTVANCGAMRTDVIPAAHSWDEGVITTEPTCTADGVKTYTCTVEGCQSTKTEAVAKLPHTYGQDDIKTIDATCTQPGQIVKTCSICQAKSSESIPMKGHTFVDGTCKDCQAKMQLTSGNKYNICLTDGTNATNFATYRAGSNAIVKLPTRSDIVQTKTETAGGKVRKLTLVGFSNDGGKTVFQYGTELPGSIIDAMTSTGQMVKLEAVYETEDGLDQSYDYTISGKKVDRKTFYTTSDGITVTVNTDSKQIIVTIPKGYDKEEVSVDATAALGKAWASTYMPGGAGSFYAIVIDNQSDKEFRYKANSFIIQSPSFSPDGTTYDFENEVLGYITGARTFDGQTPYYTYGTIRTSNEALKALYGMAGSGKKLTVNQLLDSTLGKELQNHGYAGGIDDLAEYYLDYINAMKGTSYTNLNQVPDSILTTTGPLGGYVVNSYAKESNSEVAGVGYSYFYNRLLGVVPQDNTKDPDGALSLGNYMSGKASYESYCSRDWAKINTGEQTALTSMGFYINGPYCTNPYQYMDFGFEIGFQLTSKVEDEQPINPPVNPPVVDPVPPVDPNQPLPPDEHLEDPNQSNEPTGDVNQPLPSDEHLVLDDNVKATKSENPDQPKTGDESQMALYLTLAMSAGAALVITLRNRKENQK